MKVYGKDLNPKQIPQGASRKFAKFLGANKDLIQANDFKTLYERLEEELQDFGAREDWFSTTGLTLFLQEAGINPLKSGVVPEGYLEGAHIEEFTVPEGIKSIEDSAFADSSIRELTLPTTIEKIENFALYTATGSNSQLLVIYPGTCEQLQNVDIGSAAFLEQRTLIQCRDGHLHREEGEWVKTDRPVEYKYNADRQQPEDPLFVWKEV